MFSASTLTGFIYVSLCRATTALTRTRAKAQAIVAQHFPALLQAQTDLKVNQLIAEQLQKVEPAFAYFDTKTAKLKATRGVCLATPLS